MAIRIVTDSAADYTLAEIEKRKITCIPMSITLGDETYLDCVELTKEEFFEKLKLAPDQVPRTSQPSPASFLECFEEAREAGDTVIAILLSSALSGTVQAANLAKEMAGYDKIYIIDSRHATLSMRILVDQAVMMRRRGLAASEIVAELEMLKGRIQIFAGLDTLEYLYKGGRISRTQANLGGMVNLKPVITFLPAGTVEVCGKQIGFRHAYKQVMQLIQENMPDTSYPIYFIYSGDSKNCVNFIQYLRKRGGEFPEPRLYGIGATIGSHIGPGAFGIVYVKSV